MPLLPAPQLSSATLGDINLIKTISSDITNENKPLAISNFIMLLQQFKNIGRYNATDWPEPLTQAVYDLAKLVCDKSLSSEFLYAITSEINSSTPVQLESLLFIESEIKIYSWGLTDNRLEPYIRNLSEKFVNNAEFLHDLGHIEGFKKNYLTAKNYYRQAFQLNPYSQNFWKSCYSSDIRYIETLIESEQFDQADIYTNDIIKSKVYENDVNISNWFIAILSRIKDHRLIRTTLDEKGTEIENSAIKIIETERIKAIELIGIFTAIIAFILTTVSFIKDFTIDEVFTIEIVLGIILILFAISISIIFRPSKNGVFKDIRFYSFLIFIVSLIYIYYSNRN